MRHHVLWVMALKQESEERNNTGADMEYGKREQRERGHENSGNKKLSNMDMEKNIENQLDGT